jgi:hypothetical protein
MNWKGRRLLLAGVAFLLATALNAQQPEIFDVSQAVAGARRIETLYFFTVGRWSDADEHVGAMSTHIQCYKAFGFCDVASAEWAGHQAGVNLTTYDILRWDRNEIIAVDSSAICVVNTIRADLLAQKVTLSSSDKGVSTDPLCKGSDKLPTAFLTGRIEIPRGRVPGKH